MQIIKSAEQMRSTCAGLKQSGMRIGFVPTMGALHDGHLSLVRAAHKKSDVVVASIYVNPTQFGPNEDFSRYPRPIVSDQELLERERVEILFMPTTDEMYPPGATTFIVVEGLSDRLDGKSRPGHFRGVTTIVNKLFNITTPDFAYFGQKDAAQAAIIRKMVRDLRLPVNIVVGAIVREPDGLAMSSRNVYLDPKQRQQALALSHSLQSMISKYAAGERNTASLKACAERVFQEEPEIGVDYIEIVDPDTLESAPAEVRGGELAAVAAKVGTTRLIDNMILPVVPSR